jgi:hypothetical protein
MQGTSGLLVTTGRLGVYLWRCHGGQGGPGITGGEESHERGISPAVGLGQIPATAGVEIEGGGLGELPGVEGKLPPGFAGAGVRRNGRSMARPRALRIGVSGREC